MSRRDEREIARRLAGQPAPEPPPDLLSRLKADLPAGLALGEEAAARRRPGARTLRWALAASLVGMMAGGLVAVHTLEEMHERALTEPRSVASPPARGSSPAPALEQPAVESATPPHGTVAGAAAAGESDALAGRPTARLERSREGRAEKKLVSPQIPLAPPVAAASPAAPPAPRRTGSPEVEDFAVPAGGAGGAASARPLVAEPQAKSEAAESRLAGAISSSYPAEAPAGARPVPPPAAPEARAKASASTAMQKSSPASPERRLRTFDEASGTASGTAAEGLDDGKADRAGTATAAADAQALAASYDTDPEADSDGWSVAAGGTFLPPPVAGHPARPAPGTRWVRFRLRAPASRSTAPLRVEIGWSSAAVERRLLGGSPATGAMDVFELTPAALRRGWTAVYEVRFAPAAVRSTPGPLARLSVREGGANGRLLRELQLELADFSPAWREAPPALRLPCLAAAFAERQAHGSGDDLSDLLAAVRSLAAASGDRRADELVVRMLKAARPRPAGPP